MSDSEAIDAYRQTLERTIEARKARLKTRNQTLKTELHKRLTPKGIMSRFPIATLAVAAGVGLILGRAIRAMSSPRPKRIIVRAETPTANGGSQNKSRLAETLKEMAFQALAEFALNKTRAFLVSQFSRASERPSQKKFANIAKPATNQSD